MEFADDAGSAVRGPVIHHDHFHLRGGHVLLEHAHDRLLNEAFVVVRVDQYADE